MKIDYAVTTHSSDLIHAFTVSRRLFFSNSYQNICTDKTYRRRERRLKRRNLQTKYWLPFCSFVYSASINYEIGGLGNWHKQVGRLCAN